MKTEQEIQEVASHQAIEFGYPEDSQAKDHFENGFRSAILLMQEQHNWISVEDKMPDYDFSVLLYNGNYISKGYFSYYRKQWEDCETMKKLIWDATHWQPLPSPPKAK